METNKCLKQLRDFRKGRSEWLRNANFKSLVLQKFWSEVHKILPVNSDLYVKSDCSMLLLLSRKEVVKVQSRLCDFVLRFKVWRRACYSFWGRPNLVIYRWNFADPLKGLGAREKHHLLAASHRHLVWTDFLQRCLGMSPKGATPQLPTVPQPCFQRWRLKSTGQVSPVQFSCTKKVLMKLEVSSACQEDFVIWFPNKFPAW